MKMQPQPNPRQKKQTKLFVAVYCQHCGYTDPCVSAIAIDAIRRIAQTDDAIINCKQCGQPIPVNFTQDILKIGKNGKVKLPDTTRW
jgi:Fe-S-cluster-containing hydrogenase component 2